MKRITLRLPDDLHEQLIKVAGKSNRSLNAQIVTYLQDRLRHLAAADKEFAEMLAGDYSELLPGEE